MLEVSDIYDEHGEEQHKVKKLKVTPELIEELKKVDISNYPIPEKYGAAYKEDGKQRLIIDRMVLKNFKSYFGEILIGPFDTHFTAIIGANGSGKSNIIDALMFVFGSKMSKIRSQNVKAVIHKSTMNPNISSCSVTVFFHLTQDEPEGESTTVPNSEFSVKRAVTKSGVSKYYYNDIVMTRNELRTKLENHGIDMDHNRFLILQGEVESIASMKYKGEKENEVGLLEYLDDIIGTSRLRDAVKDLQMKIDVVDDERQLQLKKLQTVGHLKDELVVPVREMVKVLIIENRINHTKHKSLTARIYKKDKSLVKYREQKEKLVTEVEEQQIKLNQVMREASEAKGFFEQKNKELAAAKKAQRKQQDIFDNDQIHLTKNATSITSRSKLLESKKKEKVKAEEKIDELKNRPSEGVAESEKLKTELEIVKARKETIRPELEGKNAEASQRSAVLEEERSKIGNQLVEAKKNEDEANVVLTKAQIYQMNFREPLEKAEKRYDENRWNLEKAEENMVNGEKRLKEITVRIQKGEERCTQADDRFEKIQSQEQQIRVEYESCRNRYQEASHEKKSNKKAEKAMSQLMVEKQSGRIPGIYGRLGDLGNIDPMYDVAISTTCSGLDMIIVDTYDTTKKVLDFISKDPHFPRKTIISLDKVQHLRNRMQPIKTPFNLPRLFDLVKPQSPEFAPAFYFTLQDTLVCDDIDTARRASTQFTNQRFRVVTIDGNVVETSGTLTGGGKHVSKGRIGTDMNAKDNTLSEEALAKLKEEMEEWEEKLEEIRQKLKRAEVEQVEAKNNLQQDKNRLNKLEFSQKELEGELGFLRSNQEQLRIEFEKAQDLVTDEKIKENKKNVEDLKQKRDEFSKISDEIEAKYNALSQKIDSIYDDIAGETKAIYNQYCNREKDIEVTLSDLRKMSSKAEIELKKITTSLELLIKVVTETEEELENLKKEKDEITEKMTKDEALLKEREELVKTLEAELQAESEKTEANDKAEVELKKTIAEIKSQLKTVDDNLGRGTEILKHFNKERDSLILHDINVFLDDTSVSSEDQARRRRLLQGNISDSDDEDNEDNQIVKKGEIEAGQTQIEEDDFEDLPDAEFDSEIEETSPEKPIDENRLSTFREYSEEEIEAFDIDELEKQCAQMGADKKCIETKMDKNILEKYLKIVEEYKINETQLIDLTRAFNAVQDVHDKFISQRRHEFSTAITTINEHLRYHYYTLSLGGTAFLSPVAPAEHFDSGMKFLISPKSKGYREIHVCSGGEKTIASLALIFALHQFQPTPFYVMDEIDAALDMRNVGMISRVIKERTKNSQFIVISLRDAMFQKANRLVGVFKVHDMAGAAVLDLPQPKNTQRRRTRLSQSPIFSPS